MIFVCSSYLYWVLTFLAYNDEKHRNQGQIQQPCRILDEVIRNFLPFPITARRSILNMVEFLEPSLKTLACTKSSSVSCESQSFLIISKCSHKKSLCFSLLLFKTWWSTSEKPFRLLLPLVLSVQSMVIQSQNYLW